MARTKNAKPTRSSKKSDIGYTGPEPEFTDGQKLNRVELAWALQWYNYYDKSHTEEIVPYLENNKFPKKTITTFKRVAKSDISATLGRLARIANRGGDIGDSYREWIKTRVKTHVDYVNMQSKAKKEKKVEPTRKSPVDGMKEHAGEVIAELDEIVDYWEDNSEFSTFEFLSQKNVPGKVCVFIRDYYVPLRDELEAVVKKTDKELVEGYSNMKVKDRRALHKFVSAMVTEIDRYIDGKRSMRKPRKTTRKVKSASKLVEKVQYLEKDDTYQIISSSPEKIIGAEVVFLYDVKQNQLKMLKTNSATGFTIKGTTVQNVDPKYSVSKRVTKGAVEALAKIGSLSKLKAQKAFNGLKNASKEANGRINSNTVIIKVFK